MKTSGGWISSPWIRAGAWVVLVLALTVKSSAAPTVWSGFTFEFIKPPFATPPPADEITAAVALTRASTAGTYNAAQELAFSTNSPADTRWATNINNPTETIVATNYAALSFSTWSSAYGGPSQIVNNIVGRDAVVHLVSDDIYLDLRFTAWAGGAGGGHFIYRRAEPPIVPEPAAGTLVITGVFGLIRRRSGGRA
jgi:hypothetical protein